MTNLWYNTICSTCSYKFNCKGKDKAHWKIFPNQCKEYQRFFCISTNPFNKVYNIMTTKEQIAVMKAYADGKSIEAEDENGNWELVINPKWNWGLCNYRVRPKLKYRPYNSAEEFLQASKEHGPYIKLDKGDFFIPTRIHDLSILNDFIKYTWQDGTICGIKKE